MYVVITYDVSTIEREGQIRLRKIAKACESWGQRVQKSVFECNLSEVHLERLKNSLLKILKVDEDSLRIYRLHEPWEKQIESFGLQKVIDFQDPLVV